MLTLQETRSIHDSMNIPKLNLLLIFTFYYKYLKYKDYINLGDETILYLIFITLRVLLECKAEKRNSQCEHGQPMEQSISLFCTCHSGVAGCQSQHQCHIWPMNSMFEANCTGK